MSRSIREIAFSCVALSMLMTILQTQQLFYYIHTVFLFKVFVVVSIVVILSWMAVMIRDYLLKRGIFYYVVQKFRSSSIPRLAKYLIAFVFVGNLGAISLGSKRYPFYEVGMYRQTKEFKDRDKIHAEHKYYYWQGSQYKIVNLRKEASFFLAEYFGWGYTADMAYSMTYFHKGDKENFDFLSARMKELGIDTLWVGVQSVNFKTREVTFDPDICHAITINQGGEMYYGPIYIPRYQMERCDGKL